MKIKTPLVTIGLTLFSIVLYLALSKGAPYVHPITEMTKFGLYKGNVLGLAAYSFTHIGIRHLISNMVVFFSMGSLLEQHIEGKHVLGIFVSSGVLSGFIYSMIYPSVWVVGASASIAGIIAAAVIADFKKAVPVLIISVLSISFIFFPLTNHSLSFLQQEKKEASLKSMEEVTKLNTSVQSIQEQVEVLGKKIEAGNATEEEIIQYQTLQTKMQSISTEMQQEAAQAEQKQKEKKAISEGMETESMAPVSNLIHIFGVLTAVLYLAILDKELFYKFKRDIVGIFKS